MYDSRAAEETDSSSAVRKHLMRAVLLDALASDIDIATVSTVPSPSSSAQRRCVCTRQEDKEGINEEDIGDNASSHDVLLDRCLNSEELGMHLQDITLEPKDQVRKLFHMLI
jgi:hypothetical protein